MNKRKIYNILFLHCSMDVLCEFMKSSAYQYNLIVWRFSFLGTGGKKNRQKERRLMKGFNIAPQPSSVTGSLPPVAEFMASLQQHHQDSHHHDIFGSTLSGIFNNTPRKMHQHSSTVSSSQGSINEGHHSSHRGIGRFALFIFTKRRGFATTNNLYFFKRHNLTTCNF